MGASNLTICTAEPGIMGIAGRQVCRLLKLSKGRFLDIRFQVLKLFYIVLRSVTYNCCKSILSFTLYPVVGRT